MPRSWMVVLWMLCGCLSLQAQKKQKQVQVEVGDTIVLVSTGKVGKYEPACPDFTCMVYVRIENKSSSPLPLPMSEAFMKTRDGKGLPQMQAEAAIKLLHGRTAGTMVALLGYRNREPMQQSIEGRLLERAFNADVVPEKSFVEGIVYFRGSGDKKNRPVELFLPFLLPDAIPLQW